MSRPYISAEIAELRTLFEAHKDSPHVLKQLFEELSHRKSKGALALKAQVSQRLAGFEDDDTEDGHVTGADAPTRRATRRSRSGELFPRDVETFGPHPDDQQKPKRLTLIRPPGTTGLPDAWQRPLKREISLSVAKDADLPDLYPAALNALVSEIKKSGSGQKRYELEKGRRIEAAGREILYAFLFTDEAELFEEAQVEVQVAGQRVEGSIVSISAGRLVIAVREDLGSDIRHAVLLIDATALIEALVEKIEQVKKGELTLNRDLADAVVGRKSEPDAPVGIPGRTIIGDLDPDPGQCRAIDRALSAAVTWIWGPPGCGKTKTLGEIVRSAFEDDRRILVCSNTNKAVDQILFQVCKALEKEHVAMQEGRVVRLGRIADDKLESEYAEYVTVDGIVERRSKDLKTRLRQVEEEIAHIDAHTERARSVLARFEVLDRAERLVVDEQGVVNNLARDGKQANADLWRNEARRSELKAELRKRKNALMRFFKRSEEAIQRDIRTVEKARPEIESKIATVKSRYALARTRFEAAVGDRDRKKKDLASEDRAASDRQMKEAKDQRDPLMSELREIGAKISALRDSILKDARVLGATCTKTYLSVKDIGQVDMVIIDEASTVMPPMAWFAAGLSRERVVICGDFRQIPPIVQSEQEAIIEILSQDAFSAAGVGFDHPDLMMLDTQYRMDPKICALINGPMYDNLLTTSSKYRPASEAPPAPFDGTLTIIDTSDLWPFESQNAFFSRFNLMHALLARNLAWYFDREGAITIPTNFGICTPYAAQAKVIHKLLEGEGLDKLVHVGTVHRYQGDERRMILLEIPESHGGAWNIGQFVQGVRPEDVGARLINVSVSRAQDRLIVMANLTYFDKKLPEDSLLRSVLFEMQEQGRVVSGTEVLKLRPIESDLKGLIGQMPFEEITETLGIFDEKAFERALKHDIHNAKESVVLFSGYVTPSRVGKLGDLFRSKIVEGVRIRCVTRPPQTNGSIPPELGREALDMLEGIGVTVDCRAKIHQKVCLIDNRIVWQGSLNALSHAGHSDETMFRAVNVGYAKLVAANMSKRRIFSDKAAETVADAENPRCPDCDSRTVYSEGRFGPFYRCELECGWRMSQKKSEKAGSGGAAQRGATEETDLPEKGPACPECGSETRIQRGRYGRFYGCVNYPNCRGTVNPAK